MKRLSLVVFAACLFFSVFGCSEESGLVSKDGEDIDPILSSNPLSVLNYDHTKSRVYLYEDSYNLGRPGCGDSKTIDTLIVTSEIGTNKQFYFTYNIKGNKWKEELSEIDFNCCTSYVSYDDSILFDTATISENAIQCQKEITRCLLGHSLSYAAFIPNWMHLRGDTLASWKLSDHNDITYIQKIGLVNYNDYGSGNGWTRSKKIQLIRYDDEFFSIDEIN